MNINMTGLRWFSKNACMLVLWMKVALSLEWLKGIEIRIEEQVLIILLTI